MIIWIIQAVSQGRGSTSDHFYAACQEEKEIFEIVNKCQRDFNYFKACKYDLAKQKWVGSSKRIDKGMLFNHAKDGHLDPPENRDEKGVCKNMHIWGPQCPKCRENIFKGLKLPKDFEGK